MPRYSGGANLAAMRRIALSLAGHTNYGKTTIARTLLRRAVGEVDDRAHVTDVADSHRLAGDDKAEVVLWDLPGFGDSVRLRRRLQTTGLLGWLQEKFDQWTDRPLWCAQQSMRNVKEQADVVLYIADATADPQASLEVRAELEVLAWAKKPVVLVLNQGGLPESEKDAGMEMAWSEAFQELGVLKDVVAFDGWMRSWVQEVVLMERIGQTLPRGKRPDFQRVMRAWSEASHHAAFRAAVLLVARHLVETRDDESPVEGERWTDRVGGFFLRKATAQRRAASKALMDRLVGRSAKSMRELLAVHGLEGAPRERVEELVAAQKGKHPGTPPEIWAVISAVGGGISTGLAADIMAGGLTGFGGALLGGLLGGVSAYALGWGMQLVKTRGGRVVVRWDADFLRAEFLANALRYLAVAHLGYGHEAWKEPVPEELPARWKATVEAWMTANGRRLDRALKAGSGRDLDGLVKDVLEHTLRRLHPGHEALGGKG